MKKINKILSIASVLTVLSLSFTACFNPAFYQINQDVVSESSLVDGSINSIARYTVGGKEYLVLAGGQNLTSNKGLLYKEISEDTEEHGAWRVFPQKNLPFTLHSYDYNDKQDHTGEQIIKVLANQTHLYLVTATYKNNNTLGTNSPEVIKIWAAEITDWETKPAWTNIIEGEEAEKCPLYDSGDNTYSAFSVFSTNAPIQANRSVYLRSGNGSTAYPNKYYRITGTTLTEVTDLTFLKAGSNGLVKTTTSTAGDEQINIKSVVNVNGTEIFLTSIAATTNETYSSPATKYYTSYGDSIAYGTTADDPETKVKVGGAIASLAYCSDVLLIGRGEFVSSNATSDGGIDKVELDIYGVPGTSLGNFTTNAKSQLLSSYIVQQLINATPEKSELESTLYASTTFIGTASSTQATFKNIGLWSYYPSRKNWNKE